MDWIESLVNNPELFPPDDSKCELFFSDLYAHAIWLLSAFLLTESMFILLRYSVP